LTIRKFRRPRR